MLMTDCQGDYKSNIIKFDDDIFLNYAGLVQLGFEDSEASNIFRHLFNCHPMRFAPDAYIFLNCLLSIKRDTRRITKLGIEDKPEFNFKSLREYFSLLSEERYYKKTLKKSLATDYVFCGFFTTRPLTIDLQKDNKDMLMLYTSYSSYINKVRMQPFEYNLVKESYFDQQDSFYLLSDINRSHIPWHERVKTEVYFESISVSWILERHYKSTKINFNSIITDQEYRNGLLFLEPNPETITYKSTKEIELDHDYILTTEAIIISVLFFALENESTEETLTDLIVVDRLNKRFQNYPDIEYAYICRRLKKGREKLEIDKNTELFRYKKDESLKEQTYKKDCVVIAILAQIIQEDNPMKFKSCDDTILSLIDSLFQKRPLFSDSTIRKRFGRGRRLLGISKR